MNSEIKVLTVRQPWADAILSGLKTVENRSYRTKYRGKLYIHSSLAKPSKKDILYCQKRGFDYDELHSYKGCILGHVTVTDVLIDSDNDWYVLDCYQWKLTNPVKLKHPVKAIGRLGIWTPPPEVIAQLEPNQLKPPAVTRLTQLALF
jgi:hypothetical protein